VEGAGFRIAALSAEPASEPLRDEDLARRLGCPLETVQARSRGVERTSAPDGIGPAAIAASLARRLLERSQVQAASLDQIVFATTTPDLTFPGSACLLQAELEAPGIACLDVRSQCTGFLTALDVAGRFVAAGSHAKALIAAADVPTHVMRYDGIEPELAILTGDGGAVALLEPGQGSGEVLSCITRIDGTRYREFWSEFPASRHLGGGGVARGERMVADAYRAGRHYPRIDLIRAAETALNRVPPTFDLALAAAALERVDATLIAHVDPAVEDRLSEMLQLRGGRMLRRKRAYSFGSTLPLALFDAAETGSITPGQTVALVTAGAGASWGAAVIRW
jgi:3-oxoacyl-[acyl-carrier-protein] synthase-3